MTKKDFIALGRMLKEWNDSLEHDADHPPFTDGQLDYLADFLRAQNPRFNRERWLDYIAGKCGPNGGAR